MTDDTQGTSGPEAEEGDPASGRRGAFRLWMVVPVLGAFAVLGAFLVKLGDTDINDLPSTLIDRPAPDFALASLYEGRDGLATADLQAPGVKLVNIWASWCVPCRAEHPMLEALAGRGLTVHGINYKDEPANALAFLEELGDPYTRVGADTAGRAGIEWGVYGVPETFVIDGRGHVIYKHIGPITARDIEAKIMPAVEAAKASGGAASGAGADSAAAGG